ncbi:MAG: glycoside hydrolase family 5 protein [Treponema sp.]|nr:glycoside hydrolase family 5 protein [Treponema sp.]
MAAGHFRRFYERGKKIIADSSDPAYLQTGGYQQRFFSLWKYIADHYRNEEYIAGYDLMNEPVAEGEEEEKMLNEVYKSATRAIREVDKNHIVFLKGNMWGRYFKCFFCDELGRKFADLSYKDLDELGDSFRFENCYVRQPAADIIKAHLNA